MVREEERKRDDLPWACLVNGSLEKSEYHDDFAGKGVRIDGKKFKNRDLEKLKGVVNVDEYNPRERRLLHGVRQVLVIHFGGEGKKLKHFKK